MVPDSLFVRSLADDLEQVIYGPEVSHDEPYEVTRDRALDIVRRAYETVRFMNVSVMNGNNFKGRPRFCWTRCRKKRPPIPSERSVR